MRNLLPWLALLLCGPLQAAGLTPVETPALPQSMAPRLAHLDDGHAALTWLEQHKTGHRLQLAAFDGQRFGPARTITAGRDFFVNWADTPGIAASADGSWIAHWLERSGEGTYAYDVRAVISRDRGASWSEPFSPHRDGTLTEHGFVSYYPAGASAVGMVWLDGRNTTPDIADRKDGAHHGGHHGSGGPMTLRTARINADGTLRHEALLDERVCDCCATDAGRTAEGAVVVYRDRSEDEIRDIKLVRETPQGWSEPVTVHADGWRIAGCPVNGPALLARGQEVVVAWFTLDQDVPVVRVASSRDAGRSFAPPLDLDRGLALGRVDLAWTAEGFALLWMARGSGESTMRLALFDASGGQKQTLDLLPLQESRSSGFPQLLDLGEGRMLLAWTDAAAKPDGAQVRSAVLTLD